MCDEGGGGNETRMRFAHGFEDNASKLPKQREAAIYAERYAALRTGEFSITVSHFVVNGTRRSEPVKDSPNMSVQVILRR